MKIAILGTGSVGQILGGKLSQIGNEVLLGTRDVKASLAKTEKDGMGFPPIGEWIKDHPKVKLLSFAEAAQGAEIIINATSGMGSLDALKAAGASNLKGKIIIDISNPLDFSKGFPPSLFVCNTDSLGEQIQAAFPEAKVVKTLNIVSAFVMVDPNSVKDGQPTMFVSGNDEDAKEKVSAWLKQWFGWQDVVNLGDITASRATEMILPIWVRAWGKLQTANFGLKLVR